MSVFVTAVLPVVASFLGVLFGAAIAGHWQLRNSAMSHFLQSRLSAYAALEAVLKDFNVQIGSDSAREIFRAINAAELVASDKTYALLQELQQHISAAERSRLPSVRDFYGVRVELMRSMRDDIYSYPKIREKRHHTGTTR